MKLITLTIAGVCFFLLNVQAQANRIEAWVWNDRIDMKRYTKFGPRYFFYPGNSQIDVLIGNDNLGCSLRVGTQSNNPKLLKISGPLAVTNKTDPVSFLKELGRTFSAPADPRYWRFAFKCGTTGEINVSSPPTVAVPIVITLAYGPFLTKSLPGLVIQKGALQSVSASPLRRTYSVGQSVSINVTFNRRSLDGEFEFTRVMWRLRQGKLCFPKLDKSGPSLEPVGPVSMWRPSLDFGEQGPLFFLHPLIRSIILCEPGKTVLELALSKATWTDSTVKRIVFDVDKNAAPVRRSR